MNRGGVKFSLGGRYYGLLAVVTLVDQSGRTRYELAAELGMSQATPSKAYAGKRAVTLELVCLVASASGQR